MIVVEIGHATGGLAFAKPRSFSWTTPELARQIPGLTWDRTTKTYVGWPDAVAAFAHALGEENLATIVGGLDEPSDRLKARRTPRRQQVRPEGSSSPSTKSSTALREYQREGVEVLRLLAPEGGALLADDMGLGKTVQALTAAKRLVDDGFVPIVLVVSPAVLKWVWSSEAEKWTDDFFETRVLSGTKPSPVATNGRPLLLIMNYDIAHAWIEALPKRLGVLIADEGHYLQSDRSRRSKAIKAIAGRAQARMVLSGTPMTARPRDLWNVVDTLESGRWGKNAWRFFTRHCAAHQETVAKNTTVWILDGSSHEDELALRLRFFMLRRSKADVMKDLPSRIRQIVPIKVNSRAIAPIWDEKNYRKDALRRALALAGTGKISEAVELATSSLAEGHSVVVFSHLRDTAKRVWEGISKAKATAYLATGEDVAQVRARTIAHAKVTASKRSVAVVATIDAVGVGIDLSFADVAIFVDLDWVPSKLLQAESRLHRHGQMRPVSIYYLVGLGTADEYVQRKVIERLDLYERVIGSAQEAEGLRSDLGAFETMNEDDVLMDLRAAVLRGEVLPEEDTL